MKKTSILLLISCIAAIAAAPGARAQTADGGTAYAAPAPTGGFSVDLSYELTIPSGSKGWLSTGSGAFLSARYKLPLSSRFYFEPGIGGYYSTMGSDYMQVDNFVYQGTLKNIGIRIPLMVGYEFEASPSLHMSVATGPMLNVNVYMREQAMPAAQAPVREPQSINLFSRGFRRVEGLWGLQLSFTFREHYVAGITASTAFTPLARFGNHDNKLRIRRSTLGIMLGYRF